MTTVRNGPGAALRPGSHVVVVGAGVGGLSAAIAIAAKGARVTLLERAAAVGGKAREVAVGGARIDSGPTVLTMRHVFDAVFEAAGERLDDHVTLRRAEVLARHAWEGGATLDLYADAARTIDAIGRFAGPVDAEGYRR
ncbi:MAG: NAD(P)-binding protein, partial [Polyangiales bacterium]